MRENELLYKAGQETNFFYIVLLGRVKLVNGPLKKLCQAGETVLEEVVYTNSDVKVACERAKAVGVCVVLEITLGGLKRLKEELIKNGFKLAYQEIEVMIKRNHIVKNWLRNRGKMEENDDMIICSIITSYASNPITIREQLSLWIENEVFMTYYFVTPYDAWWLD